jgi:hypothetical protein
MEFKTLYWKLEQRNIRSNGQNENEGEIKPSFGARLEQSPCYRPAAGASTLVKHEYSINSIEDFFTRHA